MDGKATLMWTLEYPDGTKRWAIYEVDLTDPSKIDLIAKNIKETIEEDKK